MIFQFCVADYPRISCHMFDLQNFAGQCYQGTVLKIVVTLHTQAKEAMTDISTFQKFLLNMKSLIIQLKLGYDNIHNLF